MKEHQKESRKANMRGRTKRFLAAVIAIIFAFAFSTTALAAGNKDGSKPQNGPDAVSGATKNNQSNNAGGNGNSNGNSSDKPDDKGGAKIKAPSFDKIESAIAELTDETVKANLTALLSAYEDAWKAKQEAVAASETDSLETLEAVITAAKAALDAALEAAGVSSDSINGKPVEALDGKQHENSRPTLDTEQISAAIATLDDTNADKATLNGLLTAYQEALATKLAANTAAMSEEEQLQLAYALRNAEEALLLAAREAGLIGGLGRGQFIEGKAYGNEQLDLTAILTSIAALADTDENKAALTALYEAYYAAQQAQAAADKTALTDAEFDALRDATKAAQTALIEALEAAGIDVPMLQQEPAAASSSSDEEDEDDDEDEASETDDD